jgi:hypothetical protein
MATTSNDPMFAEDLSAEERQAEVEYFARMDAAEAYGAYIERMADELGDEPYNDWDLPAALTRAHDAPYDWDPVPPTPAAPNVVPFHRRPFDRAAHCQAIAAGGGARTVALYGHQHMRTIGKAGARATIDRHGLATFKGIVKAKGWTGPRRPALLADLAAGRDPADLNRAA